MHITPTFPVPLSLLTSGENIESDIYHHQVQNTTSICLVQYSSHSNITLSISLNICSPTHSPSINVLALG